MAFAEDLIGILILSLFVERMILFDNVAEELVCCMGRGSSIMDCWIPLKHPPCMGVNLPPCMGNRRRALAARPGLDRRTGETTTVRCIGKSDSIKDCCIPLKLPPDDRRLACRGTGEAAPMAVKEDLLFICGILYCIVLEY